MAGVGKLAKDARAESREDDLNCFTSAKLQLLFFFDLTRGGWIEFREFATFERRPVVLSLRRPEQPRSAALLQAFISVLLRGRGIEELCKEGVVEVCQRWMGGGGAAARSLR